jgi:large subunit ribosomal protein L22
MEVTSSAKSVRISPRKLRLVADLVRNMPADKALVVLSITKKRAALAISKAISSAVANAVHNLKADATKLMIKKIEIGEGQVLKRFHASTRGRVHPYKKRSSHILVAVEEVIKNGTKN